jgi:hypothetical protein
MEQGLMKVGSFAARHVPAPKSNQRGVVLFIALIVMVAMSLAAVALMRSVDTTTAVIGNLAFRQASILPANYGVEDAAAALFSDASPSNVARIPDVTVANAANNYYPTHDPTAAGWDDKFGIPTPLQTKPATTFPRAQVDGAGNQITYVIERMCNPKAPAGAIPATNGATRGWCDMMAPKQPPGCTINDPCPGADFKQVFYRVTVRVDGPKGTNTVSFAQAMLR